MIVAWAYDLLPPEVPAEYPDQRWFKDENGDRVAPHVEVFRNGKQDFARVDISHYSEHVHLDVSARLSPHFLRRLAAALLSAAHDIELNPAPVPLNDIAPCDRDERDPDPDPYVYPIHPAVLQED